MPQAPDLVATWRLVAWENVTAAGVSHPMGPDPVGYISYAAGGRMSVQVMRRGRSGLAADMSRRRAADLLRECSAAISRTAATGGRGRGNRNPPHRLRPPSGTGGNR